MALLHIVLFASFVGVVLAAEWNCSATSGTFTLSSDCVVSSQVEVTGILSLTGVVNASGVLPRVIGGGSNRLFYVVSGGNLTIRSLNLTGGNVSYLCGDSGLCWAGAVYVRASFLTMVDSSISNNKARRGGGVFVDTKAGDAIKSNVHFTNTTRRERSVGKGFKVMGHNTLDRLRA